MKTCTVKIKANETISPDVFKRCAFTVVDNDEIKTVNKQGKNIFPVTVENVLCGSMFFVNIPCFELSTFVDNGKKIDGDGETEIFQTPFGEVMNVTLSDGAGTL